MARFFIDRPIFAWVIAIMIMLVGALAVVNLPIAQYPDIASPEIEISGVYPGASAKTVESTVTQVIEQQMSGLDNLMYMYSTSDSLGMISVRFAFKAGTNIDIAQVQVQNKLQLAMPLLPQAVQRQGLTVAKSVKNFLIVVGFISQNNSMDGADIGDYIASSIKDQISRLPGVGDIEVFGSEYAMRIWLDPVKMEQFKLNPSDLIQAVQAQNEQVAGGQVGAGPIVKGQEINITINAASRLETKEEFENIFIRINEDGSSLYLKDVAKVELNEDMFMSITRSNGKPSSALGIKLASGGNALETIAAVKNELKTLKPFFPEGLTYNFPLDSEADISESIEKVFHTLIEAIVLVFLIMFLFLQNFRATIIPTLTIPVVLLGTFAVLAAFGFSINTLTMFGLVLAIGLLVDDAIVVVENVERLMKEEKLSPKEASYKSMKQITGALVGVAMVIGAVFIPMAFMGGSTGVIYRQFSITIVTAMVLSVIIAIIFTPSLCASLLKEKSESENIKRGFFSLFNKWFDKLQLQYSKRVAKIIKEPRSWLTSFVVIIGLIVFLFYKLPTSFLPDEDQGKVFITINLPSNATFERTNKILKRLEEYLLNDEKEIIDNVLTVSGINFGSHGQNTGMVIANLKEREKRTKDSQSAFAVKDRIMKNFGGDLDAMIFSFTPPAVLELGTSSGFVFELIDRANMGHEKLMEAKNMLLDKASRNPNLNMVRHNGLDDTEQYELNIDIKKAGAQSLTKDMITSAISAYFGSAYVNDFTDRGRTKKVYIQAESKYRKQISDLSKYYIRNTKGEMVPVSSFLTVNSVFGSPRLERYQGLPSLEINGEAANGKSTGDAMKAMEDISKELPKGFGYEWTGMSLQEAMSGSQAPILYSISLVVVLLCLAALYESVSIPFSILLVIPTGVIGALLGIYFRGMNNDIYFQIGLLTVMGLSAKNSILIVEFAKDLYEKGNSLFDATVQAVKLRLRPILMTSLCFILGCLPLMFSNGAGSGGQNAIGTTVVIGVIFATALGLFFTPIFFVIVSKMFAKKA